MFDIRATLNNLHPYGKPSLRVHCFAAPIHCLVSWLNMHILLLPRVPPAAMLIRIIARSMFLYLSVMLIFIAILLNIRVCKHFSLPLFFCD